MINMSFFIAEKSGMSALIQQYLEELGEAVYHLRNGHTTVSSSDTVLFLYDYPTQDDWTLCSEAELVVRFGSYREDKLTLAHNMVDVVDAYKSQVELALNYLSENYLFSKSKSSPTIKLIQGLATDLSTYQRYDTQTDVASFNRGMSLYYFLQETDVDIVKMVLVATNEENELLYTALARKYAKIDAYVSKTYKNAYLTMNGSTGIAVVFGEKYNNEVAHRIIAEGDADGIPIVVLIVRPLQGFTSLYVSVRSSYGVSSIDWANLLGKRAKGDERVANMFVNTSIDTLISSLNALPPQ